jgi:hypothetical protein
MAGPGSGPASSGPDSAGAQPAGQQVPRAVLRSWDEAEARLFPTIMARPDVYQQAVSLIQQLLGRLRETCLDLVVPHLTARGSAPAAWPLGVPGARRVRR